MIKQNILDQKKVQQDVIDQTIAASAQYRALQEQLAQQDDLYASLDQKVARWQKKLDNNYEQTCQEQKRRMVFMKNYGDKQQSFLETSQKAKIVLPIVIEETTLMLQKHFSEKTTRQSYDQKTIDTFVRRL